MDVFEKLKAYMTEHNYHFGFIDDSADILWNGRRVIFELDDNNDYLWVGIYIPQMKVFEVYGNLVKKPAEYARFSYCGIVKRLEEMKKKIEEGVQ